MPRVLYIIGTGFCGSTLFSFLLNSHPQIATVGETTGPFDEWSGGDSYTCSCRRTLAECPFWQTVKEQMAQAGHTLDLGAFDMRFEVTRARWADQLLVRSLRSNLVDDLRDALVGVVPPWRRAMQRVARRNVALAEAVLAVTGKQVFVDASKDPMRVRHQLRLSRVDPWVIFLVRDAPGFVSSYTQHGRGDLDVAIRGWNRMGAHAQRLFARLPAERCLRVRYEDLCRDSVGELRRVSEFLGVEAFAREIDFRSTEHHIVGNDMRLASSSEIALNERWRELLRPEQIEEIERRTRRLREDLGYGAQASGVSDRRASAA